MTAGAVLCRSATTWNGATSGRTVSTGPVWCIAVSLCCAAAQWVIITPCQDGWPKDKDITSW